MKTHAQLDTEAREVATTLLSVANGRGLEQLFLIIAKATYAEKETTGRMPALSLTKLARAMGMDPLSTPALATRARHHAEAQRRVMVGGKSGVVRAATWVHEGRLVTA